MKHYLPAVSLRRGAACAALLSLTSSGQSGGVEPWVQQAYVKASNTDKEKKPDCKSSGSTGYGGCEYEPVYGDWFGRSIGVSGDTMVVGAPFEDSDATGVNGDQDDQHADDSGAAYVLVRNGKTWTQQAYLKATEPGGGEASLFGDSVAISGDTIVIGEEKAVYVFMRQGETWSQQSRLKGSNTAENDFFGSSVAISGDTIVVGAREEDSNATGVNGNQSNNSAGDSGAAYVFVRSGTAWIQQAYLKASNTGAQDRFGISVAISGDTIVVGGYGEDSKATGVNGDQNNNSAGDSGAAYVFVRSGAAWSQQAYLKASNTNGANSDPGFGDYFGNSVAISGDTIVVGAFGEESNATGVNGNQTNNSAGFAGAAYVFTRSGAAWSQQAYLKASNTEEADGFGWSVAISGEVIVVGALTEDSKANGVNGNQSNNGAEDAGSACVFVRNGTAWTQQAYLKASNTDRGDSFGSSVAISGDTIVVGAGNEDSDAIGVNGDQTDDSAGGSGAAYVFTRPVLAPIATIQRTPAGLRLTLPVSAGESIGIQYSESMLPGTWLDIGNLSVASGLGTFTDSDPGRMARPRGYYRGFLR